MTARDALLAGPVPGGCGSAVCALRAWFVLEAPDDPLNRPPCSACAWAAADALAAEQVELMRGVGAGL